MDALQMLQSDLEKEKLKVREILDAADAEGRPVSDTEKKVSEASMERMVELKQRIEAEIDKAKFREAVDGFGKMVIAGTVDPMPVREPAVAQTKARTLGEALVSSDSFKSWAAATKAGGAAPQFTTPAVEIPYKAQGDPVLESGMTDLFASSGTAGFSTPFGLETPGFVQERLTVADLLPSVPITVGNSATYPTVETRTALTGTSQTEGSAKEGAEYSFTLVTVPLVTKAAWVKASSQFLEDAPGLAAYINTDLPFQVRQVEEAYLTAALYSAAGAAVVYTAGTSEFDSVLDAITTIREANFEPTAILIHPADWAVLLAEKFTNAGYVGGGPFMATGNPWGLRPVITQSATIGSPLVGDFARGAKVYRRGGMSVRSTNADGTDFQKNVITILAELRLACGVTHSAAFAEASVAS